MSDLPPPFALPEYSKPAPTKIKIKPQAAQSSAAVTTSSEAQGSASSNITLRVPALGAANVAKAPAQPAATAATTSASSSVAQSASLPVATPQKQAKVPPAVTQSGAQSTQPTSQTAGGYAHYPNALYHASTTASATSIPAAQKVTQSQSPTPSATSGHQLKYASLRIQPYNRKFCLDHRDGVKSWAMRLLPAETGVLIGDIAFFHDEEEESSGEDEAEQEPKQEEEEEEVEEVPVKNGRKKGKSKAKTRSQKSPAKSSTPKSKAPVAKKKVTKVGEVQVKLNGTVVKDEEKEGRWTVGLPVGSHVLEIGEVGGILWKVYAERLGET
jgi:chromatin structure-remodeling complex subunit RSC4